MLFCLSVFFQCVACAGVLYTLYPFLRLYIDQLPSQVIIGVYGVITGLVIYILANHDWKKIKE
jgi:hypothetical protein